MAHPLHELADDRPTDTATQGLMNLPNTQGRGAGEGFHTGDDGGRRARTAEPRATDLRRGHARFDALRNQRGLQLRHRSDERDPRFAHRALRVALILETAKADAQMMELVSGVSEMGHTPREAIEFPHQATRNLPRAGRTH